MRRTSVGLILALAGLLGGCNYLQYGLYLFMPEDTGKTIEPEYAHLAGHSVAIVVFASQATLYDHPIVQLEVSSVVAGEMHQKMKDVRVIDPRQVFKYQNEHLDWDQMPKTALGKQFGADYVLYIGLVEFGTVEPGSLTFFRGLLTAEAALFKTSQGDQEDKVWGRQEFRVIYPPSTSSGLMSDNDESVRYKTQKQFAEELIRKFHKHKAPAEENPQ